eukprot:gene27866-34426_t
MIPSTSTDDARNITSVALQSERAFLEACSKNAPAFEKQEYARTLKCGKAHIPIECFSTKVKGNASRKFKAIVELPNITPMQLMDFIGDNAHRKTWDKNIANLEEVVIAEGDEIESIGHSVGNPNQNFKEGSKDQVHARCVVLRCQTKQVGPVAGRDFVDAMIVKALGNGAVFSAGGSLSRSEAGAIFPETKGLVRGFNMYGCGMFMENISVQEGRPCTRMQYIIHSDLKGWFLPAVVNNVLGGSFCAFFECLINALVARGYDIADSGR